MKYKYHMNLIFRFMKKGKKSSLLLKFHYALCLFAGLNLITGQTSKAQTIVEVAPGAESFKNAILEAERIVGSIDMLRFQKEVVAATGMSPAETPLFFQYMSNFLMDEESDFMNRITAGVLNESDLPQFVEHLKQSYIQKYPQFLKEKNDYLLEIQGNNRALIANGPCVNMGFEDGTFNGWTGDWGTHTIVANQAYHNSTTPGFGQHCMMSAGMRDPYIGAAFNVIPAGYTHSVRLGNVVPGGHSARIRQTFRVDSTNFLFTYTYAVVLDDPPSTGRNAHTDPQRPYFRARLYDNLGNLIQCANYQVIVTSNLPGFVNICNGDQPQNQNNIGCPAPQPAGGSAPGNLNVPASTPGPCVDDGNTKSIYWKNWTSVSVILDNYITTNVTLEFVAADCEPKGHFGYAYVAAKCGSYLTAPTTTICSGRETKNFTAPDGFQDYQWVTPAGTGTTSGNITATSNPAGSTNEITAPVVTTAAGSNPVQGTGANGQIISFNKAGTYTYKITPYSDITGSSCSRSYPLVVKEVCPPREVTITMCETVAGTLSASGIVLPGYNTQALNTPTSITNASVTEWRTLAGAVIPPGSASGQQSNYTVQNGMKLLAMLKYPYGSDTTIFNFVVNPLPVITFQPIPPVCVGSAAFPVPVTPAPGTFTLAAVSGSGSTLTSPGGQFNPAGAGTYTVTYTTTINGCQSTASTQVVVVPKPTVNAGPDQTLCENAKTTTLAGTFTNAAGASWSGGSNIFTPGSGTTSPVSTTYTFGPNDAPSPLTLTLKTDMGTSPCPAVSDQVVINFEKIRSADAGPDLVFCSNVTSIPISGSVKNTSTYTWSVVPGQGNPASLSNTNTLNPVYVPTSADFTRGYVRIACTPTGNTLCPAIPDTMKITFGQLPKADAGPDQTLCENNLPVVLAGSFSNAGGIQWTRPGIGGVFSSGGTDPKGTFMPSSDDINNGSVTLTITTTGTGLCPPASDQVTFNFHKLITVDAGPDQTLCVKDYNVVLNLAGQVANATGKWSGGQGSFTPGPNVSNPQYKPTPAEIDQGLITLTWESVSTSLCPAVSDPVVIHIDKKPTADAGPDQVVCAGNPAVTLAGNATVTSATWTNGKGIFNPDNTNLKAGYTPDSLEIRAGKSKLILTTGANGSCPPASDSMEITIVPVPVIDAGPDKAGCTGTQFTLQVQQIPGVSYLWTNGAGNAQGTMYTLSVTASAGDQMYYITATTNLNGCKYQDSVKVTGVPMPVVALADTGVCAGLPATLEAKVSNTGNAGTSHLDYTWYKGSDPLPDKGLALTVNQPGTYSVTASAGSGCSDTDSAQVTHYPYPQPSLPENGRFCLETDYHLLLDAGPGYKYKWLPTGDTTRILTITTPGIYQVIVTSQYNCSGTDATSICESCPPVVYVSNAFTPNQDGKNELYKVYGKYVEKFHMLIFNRWGEIIFESKDMDHSWDGFYRGEPMPIGVYPWIITFEGGCGNEGPFRQDGSVTVVR